MEDIDIRHIHILEFPKQLLWTDRDLEYFLEEMPGEANRMNNDIYDVLIKGMTPGQDFSPEEAFNLAYYECVRISWAKYPESKDIFDVLEMDIQHNQSHVDYGFTDLIMNMVWAMLHSTGKAHRFADKLHSYLLQCDKLRFWFRSFFTPNDFEHSVFPYEEKEEPKYDLKFTPCPDDMRIKPSFGEWCKLTIGYKEHLIEELLMLWPIEKRETIRKRIMDEKAGQLNNFKEFAKKHIVEIIDEPESHLHINLKESIIDQSVEDEINQLKRECDEWKAKHAKLEKTLQARTDELDKWHNLFEEETKRTVMVDSLEEELDRWKKKCEEFEANKDSEYKPVCNIVIAEDRKIDVIKVLHSMCKIGLFKMKDGSKFTIKEVMKFFGEILNDNFTEYSSNLSTSKATTKESTFLEVFEELHNAAKKYLKKS